MRFVVWTSLVAAVCMAWPAGSGAASRSYIGAERCRSCHEFEYRVWAAGPHAQAHASLTEEQLVDTKCNGCHTMLPDDLAPRYLGVQCERCHGGGRYYQHDFVMKDAELARAVGLIDVTAEHCQQCHTESTPSIEPFDFAKMWKEIDHGRAARTRWEASQKPSEPSAAR